MEKSLFEKMVAGELSVEAVYQDDDVLVIKDINPQAPIHLLILPKHKATNLNDIESWSDEQAGKYLKAIGRVAKHLNITSYRIEINTGKEAGQTVFYLHSHLLAS